MREQWSAVRQDMVSGFAAAGGERSALREGMASGFAAVRGEMASGFAAVHEGMSSIREDVAMQNGLLRQEMASLVLSRRSIVLTVIATLAGLGATVATVLALL